MKGLHNLLVIMIFCKRYTDECKPTKLYKPLVVNSKLLNLLNKVNLSVNSYIKPSSDLELYGKNEYWTYPVNSLGDCEDYVLEKQRWLNEAGIPLSNLLITTVRMTDKQYHAVLIVRTTEGYLILDNLSNKIKKWTETNYQYLKSQSPSHAGHWVKIKGYDVAYMKHMNKG